MKKDDILKTIEENRDKIRAFGVKRLGLFGSSARDEDTQSSDLDFLVEFEHKTFDAYADLKEFLENLFDRQVDLVLEDALKPRLRPAILKEVVHATGL